MFAAAVCSQVAYEWTPSRRRVIITYNKDSRVLELCARYVSVGPTDSVINNRIICKMSAESFASTAAFPVRVGYKLEDINQTLCYENEEESSK